MRWIPRTLAAAVLALLPFAAAAAQKPPTDYKYRYRLLGVFDEQSGDPLEGVEVIDVLNGNKALTTATGTVSLMFLPEGGSLVRLRKIGYEVQTITVSISPADTNPLTVVLSRATQLPAVVVTDSARHYISPALRSFEERKKIGIGHFIDEAELRKNEGHTLGDVINTHIPGVTTVMGTPVRRPQAKFLVSTRKMCLGTTFTSCRSPNCYVTIYEDGVKIYDASSNTDPALIPDMEHLNSRTYAAVEFYTPGDAPPEYSGTSSGCGVLLLWSRER